MIRKFKLVLCLLAMVLVALPWALCNFERKQNRRLSQEVGLLASQLRPAQVKDRMECFAPADKKALPRKSRSTPKPVEFSALTAPCTKPGCRDSGVARPGRPKRLKNRLQIGLELENAQLGYAYSPLGFRTANFELNLALYAGLQFNYSPFLPAGVSAGLGIETRF